ncbi:Binding-protein-dependent transport systems inner membrane component [uncultured Desulfobacterium sp.]|uniref:Binding-protein-dependent transport systems inner membrane component n=1 Tax=uncultured Desulfobacterium sp. TaxID=201089 RepID=A0A445MR44_9BACT|nr:Binding-protein-dependent transport systems inner membrane component [uncultured Desulfobacterium sp.]
MNRLRWLKPGSGMLPIIVFLGLWEVAARIGLFHGNFFFPPFTLVIRESYQLTVNGVLPENFLRSLLRVLAGFSTGSAAGLIIGILMGYRECVNKTLHPIFSLLYPIPALGWLPVLMLCVGIGEMLPIIIIFICSFFPVLYNTITGIRTVDPNLVNAARTLGASEWKILFTVALPLALPHIFTGLRLEAGMAWRVVIAAEMVAIPTGIGALLMKAESLIRIDIVIVCLMVLAVMCLSFERVFIFAERKLTSRWR